MKKILVAAIAMATALVFAVPANAAAGTFRDGPYTATTSDSGTCGNNWAQDLFVRQFVATLPAVGGVYSVTEKFVKGHFTTYAGQSPASCGTGPGDTVAEGVVGTFSGSFSIKVSNGTFNAAGACEMTDYAGGPSAGGWSQCDTAGWVHGFFGTGATYEIPVYSFTYNAAGQGLTYHQWINASTGNLGDIGHV
jgi:hypothetical protein